MSKHNNFQENMLAWTKRQRNRSSVFVLVFISFLLSLNTYMLELGGKDVLNECLPLFLRLWCWLWENFVFDSRLRALYKKMLPWFKSNLWSSQDNTIEFYSYSEYLFMWKIFYPVQYFTQIVSMLAMFGQFFVNIFSRQATYLRYIWQHILSTFVIYYMHCASTFPAHLTI